jgi:hypothetical protein
MSSTLSLMDLCTHSKKNALAHAAKTTNDVGPWWLSGSDLFAFSLSADGVDKRIDCSSVVSTSCLACAYAAEAKVKNRK